MYARPVGVPDAQELADDLAPYLDHAYDTGNGAVPDELCDRAQTLIAATADRLTVPAPGATRADVDAAAYLLLRGAWLAAIRDPDA